MIFEEKLYRQLQDPEIMDKISLEDWWLNEPLKEMTYWFDAPKALIEDEFPEADISVICITLPSDSDDPKEARSEIWASRDGIDYDYCSVGLPYIFIEQLLEKAKGELK